MPIPYVDTPEAYQQVFNQRRGIAEAIRTIAARHGLGQVLIRRFPQGTNFVYAAGPDHVVKLFAPLYANDWALERDGLMTVGGRLSLPSPEVVAEGELEGWPYLILRRLEGRPAKQVWQALSAVEQEAAAEAIGAWIASLQQVPPPVSGPLVRDWDALLSEQLDQAVDRHGQQVQDPVWLDALSEFLAEHRGALSSMKPRVLLHGDVTDGNVLLGRRRGGWVVTGVIDFAVAMTGAPDYEFVAPAFTLARGDVGFIRAMYRGAGVACAQPESLLAWSLVHRFARLAPMIARAPAVVAGDFKALARCLYGGSI